MFGSIWSMKPTEDSTLNFCTTSAFNLYIPISSPDETSTYIRCNYTWTRCTYTSTVTSLTLCDGSGCDWIVGRHLQRRPVPSSQITQAICPKRFWDEIWARHHALHFLSIASEDISLHCIGSKQETKLAIRRCLLRSACLLTEEQKPQKPSFKSPSFKPPTSLRFPLFAFMCGEKYIIVLNRS